MVFLDFLGIDQFVWARVFCELRKGCCVSLDCSGVAQKINMRKIEVSQGSVGDGGKCGILCSNDVWWCQIDVSKFVDPRLRAMLQDHMARRTCFREEYYTGTRRISVAGKIAGNVR